MIYWPTLSTERENNHPTISRRGFIACLIGGSAAIALGGGRTYYKYSREQRIEDELQKQGIKKPDPAALTAANTFINETSAQEKLAKPEDLQNALTVQADQEIFDSAKIEHGGGKGAGDIIDVLALTSGTATIITATGIRLTQRIIERREHTETG